MTQDKARAAIAAAVPTGADRESLSEQLGLSHRAGYLAHVVTGRRPPSAAVCTALYLLGLVDAETAQAAAHCPVVGLVEAGAMDKDAAWVAIRR